MFRIINNEFKIIIVYKEFLYMLDKGIENILRKDMYYKDYIRNTALELLELILRVNNIEKTDNLKIIKEEIKGKISVIDFLLERLFIKKYINEKWLVHIGEKLIEINKMTTVWMDRMIMSGS